MRNRHELQDQDRHHAASGAWPHPDPDFVLLPEQKPPARIVAARERMIMCRLYLGLIKTINDDYGGLFASHSDSASLRAVGIYVLLRTLMCSPVHPNAIAQALKLPRTTVIRRLQEMMKSGYVERVGNAYRVTDKVNIPDVQTKVDRRIAMIRDTANRLAELQAADGGADPGPNLVPDADPV